MFEQTRHHGRVAGGVIGHLNGADFQRGYINTQVNLTLLTAVIGAMFFGFPLAFAKHFDAGAINKEV